MFSDANTAGSMTDLCRTKGQFLCCFLQGGKFCWFGLAFIKFGEHNKRINRIKSFMVVLIMLWLVLPGMASNVPTSDFAKM